MNAIQLSIFSSRISAVCDEMGAVLRRAAFSPNIRDRLDFSCAVFDPTGELCAQAAHIPVHLGSMPMSVKAAIESGPLEEGDLHLGADVAREGRDLRPGEVEPDAEAEDHLAGQLRGMLSAPGSLPHPQFLGHDDRHHVPGPAADRGHPGGGGGTR